MVDLRQVKSDILSVGRIDGHELELLKRQVYAGGRIDRATADSLVELHKRVQHSTPAFEQFFYHAVKDHILAQGRIDTQATAWLSATLFADGRIDDEERKFLHELKGEAQDVCPEFEELFEQCMTQPQEQRTCG